MDTTDTRNIIEDALLNEANTVWHQLVELLDAHSTERAEQITIDFISRNDGHRVTSRSTSLISNLVADVRRATATAFLTELRIASFYPDREGFTLRDRMEDIGSHRITDIVR